MLATSCTFGLLYTRACSTWARAMSMLYFSAISCRFLAVNCFSASGNEIRVVSWALLCSTVLNRHVSTNAIRANEVNVIVVYLGLKSRFIRQTAKGRRQTKAQ